MKLSLPTRVFLAYAVVTALFGGSVFFLVHQFTGLFDYVVRVHKVLDSTNEDLRLLDRELRQVESGLNDHFDGTYVRAARHIQEMNIRLRLRNAVIAVSRIRQHGDWSQEVMEVSQKSLALLEKLLSEKSRLIQARRSNILALVRARPDTDIALLKGLAVTLSKPGLLDRNTAAVLGAHMRGLLLWLQGKISRLASLSSTLSRLAYIQLDRQVTRTSTVSLFAPAVALIISILVMLLVLLWLRPVGFLVKMVRRITSGNYDLQPQSLGVREFDMLGTAIFQLAMALKARDAEIRQHQQNLVQSERMAAVGKTASVMAHEIRNPLNSISLNLDMLKERLEAEGQFELVADYIRIIEREVNRLSNITGEYLKFGRMSQSVMEPCDITALVKELLEFMREELAKNNVELKIQLPNKPIMVTLDAQRMRQALMNLVKNAIEAMQGQNTMARLDIGVEEKGRKVLIWVKDTGPGISPGIMQDLFEPFASTKPGGTGLGLAFVQQVAAENNGRVWAQNVPEGGAIFYVELNRILE